MAVTAVVWFVATAAQLWIGARCDGVAYMEITRVNIVHVVAYAAHFIRKTGCVTLETFVLLMAGIAVATVAFGFSAMAKCPGCAVGF